MLAYDTFGPHFIFVIAVCCDNRYNIGGPQLICSPVNIDGEAPPVLLTVVDIFAPLDYFQPH